MDYKNSNAATTTITYDKNKIEAPTNNIYEAITIIAKRAQQINGDLKNELIEKLEEFATYTDSLDEVFENKEQIEVSKFYEKLPKPTAIAVEEWLEGKIYHRNPEEPQK
ncbi:DNA-directed RNA polymerase subunit omega [Lutibacter sp. B1]|jgi:DNA-directed RNA polymerase subunit K/omega|uniref:DNA-directed RNA polymerase subunit omega n=1 Tax=Lutibacter sp. B1 TaxID=2725996 RepID=UPI001456AC38|nr:DNA-directed RNA polymerase subunit omega [Lutibacter sp. B1]NLP58201.1 DNA-directed RNA polymerase subunit omega [Lutibacter sp. B1]